MFEFATRITVTLTIGVKAIVREKGGWYSFEVNVNGTWI